MSLHHGSSAGRSHIAAAAPPGSDSEGLLPATEDLDLTAAEAEEAAQYEVVEPRYNEWGEVDEAKIASEFGVKRDEDGDIVFAQRDRQGNLTFEPDVEPHDPMFHGKWVEIDGVEVKMPDYDFSQHDWILRVEDDIGWPTFWKYATHAFVSLCGLQTTPPMHHTRAPTVACLVCTCVPQPIQR